MKGLGLALGLAALLAAASSSAQGGDLAPSPPLVVLVFHPDDGVDPLGFPAAGSDAFAARYGPLVADKGRFDFPFFVSDGVLPIEAIPDPAKPFASAVAAYTQAVEARSGEEAAATLDLSSASTRDGILVQVTVQPRADLSAEDLHVRVAVVEDHVEYQPPPGLTNGITDHRFTVRAYLDLGAPAEAPMTALLPLDPSWDLAELSVAAWLQVDAPSPRFDAREVVQATQAPVGEHVVQAEKAVLVEMLSATWCDPCLYGDRAVEELAVSYGVAEASSDESGSRYLHLRTRDALAIAASVAIGVGVVALARRRA